MAPAGQDGTVVVTESKSIRKVPHVPLCSLRVRYVRSEGNSLYASGGFRFAISEQQSSAEAETCSSLTAVRSGLSLTMPFHLLIQCHLETFCHVTPPSQSLLIFSVNERQC